MQEIQKQRIGKSNKRNWLNKTEKEKKAFSQLMRNIALRKKYKPPSHL